MADLDDERTPLLRSCDAAKPDVPARSRAEYGQLTLLTLYRSAHPICFAFIFPLQAISVYQLLLVQKADVGRNSIAPFLVQSGVATPENVGTSAGLVEASYSVALLVGLAPAVIVSDTFGRKPAVLLGLICAALASSSFGFAGTLPQMVIIRALVGLSVAFIPATVATMFIELATAETQPLHFALNGLGWQVGSMVAPLIGGVFAAPATTWPSLFTSPFWQEYPFALPCLAVGAIVGAMALAGAFCTKETLPASQTDYTQSTGLDADGKNGTQASAPLLGMLTWHTTFSLFLWFGSVFQSFLAYSCEVLFFYSSRHLGGLELTSQESALLWSIRPLLSTLYGTLCYPRLARSYGAERLLKICSFGTPLLYLAYLALAVLAGQGLSKPWIFAVIILCMVWQAITGPAGTACVQVLSSRAPSRRYLTRINTAAEYASNVGHGLGAFIGSNWWRICAEQPRLGGRAVWVLHFALASGIAIIASRLTVEEGWREKEEAAEVREDSS